MTKIKLPAPRTAPPLKHDAKQDTEAANTAILEFLSTSHTTEEFREFLLKIHTHLTLMLITDFRDNK